MIRRHRKRIESWRGSRWWSLVHVNLETLRGTDRIACVDCAWMRWKMKFGWFEWLKVTSKRKMILIYHIILLIYILQWKWSFFLSFFMSSRYLLYFIGYTAMKWNLSRSFVEVYFLYSLYVSFFYQMILKIKFYVKVYRVYLEEIRNDLVN